MMRFRFFFFFLSLKYLHFKVTSSPSILGGKQSGSYKGWEAGCTPGRPEDHWGLATPMTLQQGLGHESPKQLEDTRLLRFPCEGTVPVTKGLPWYPLWTRMGRATPESGSRRQPREEVPRGLQATGVPLAWPSAWHHTRQDTWPVSEKEGLATGVRTLEGADPKPRTLNSWSTSFKMSSSK